MQVTFRINFKASTDERLFIFGSHTLIGKGKFNKAKPLENIGNDTWQLKLDFPSPLLNMTYHYFVENEKGKRRFEEWNQPHHLITEGITEQYILFDTWYTRPEHLFFYTTPFTKGIFRHEPVIHLPPVCEKKVILHLFAASLTPHQTVYFTGNSSSVGNWNPFFAIEADSADFPLWTIILDAKHLPPVLEGKFILKDTTQPDSMLWEEGRNRTIPIPQLKTDETAIIELGTFKGGNKPWRKAGSVIPVFSLRSKNSFGIGDFADLRLYVEWAVRTHQQVVQTLPINDTTKTYSWEDSYPYSAISVYALHPLYISLHWLGELKGDENKKAFEEKRLKLNALKQVDYEQVCKLKTAYLHLYFEQSGTSYTQSKSYHSFIKKNENWLVPYAAFCYLRDTFHTSDFSKWKEYAIFNKEKIKNLCNPNSKAWPIIKFHFFVQYIAQQQLKMVRNYARTYGIMLKGDLPIGVNRSGVETWTEPQFFHLDGQTGAPPDAFSKIGQNWSFPTYNWDVLEQDHFNWWKRRLRALEEYFDCMRIDHILGFFRIWEVPYDYLEGLCGHFRPSLPLSPTDIEERGLPFNKERFTTSLIHESHLADLFGDQTLQVSTIYLEHHSADYFSLKDNYNTQRKIENAFEKQTDKVSLEIKKGLFAICNEKLFLPDMDQKGYYHPRISAASSYVYQELSKADKEAFDKLYLDFFYHRHNYYWQEVAYRRLTPLTNEADLLICGEDLGMIPDSVPNVMNNLRILSLEIERMPKRIGETFSDLPHLPYRSVCCTSSHDMSPIRSWWEEDEELTQAYYNQILRHYGKAPKQCTTNIAKQILENHLSSPSMFAIFPLQDWLAISQDLRLSDPHAERINVPSNPHNYWNYRMHLTMEELLSAHELNETIRKMIKASGR